MIDDEAFFPKSNLSTYGYNIIPLGDISSVSDVENHDIVLCDLIGVGLHFDKKMQGASLIKEMKRIYPDKYVIAYTAAALSASVAKQADTFADKIIRKDTQIDEWVDKLDGVLDLIQDPYFTWNRIRINLVSKGVETRELIVLEDAFVRSILSGDKTFSAMDKASSNISLSDDVRAIINGLISSAAISFIFQS